MRVLLMHRVQPRLADDLLPRLYLVLVKYRVGVMLRDLLLIDGCLRRNQHLHVLLFHLLAIFNPPDELLDHVNPVLIFFV